MAGALLMVGAGIVFASNGNYTLLLVAAIVGVISPTGNEIGPFLPVEQAALTGIIADEQRTRVFGWYAFSGSLATATGALVAGWSASAMLGQGIAPVTGYRTILVAYALFGLILFAMFWALSAAIEPVPSVRPAQTGMLGLHESRGIVFKLSALFALDAFAGGFVVQSMLALWFSTRFGASPAMIGSLFFGANVLAGFSALYAARIAARIGLVKTMVYTHIPSNILLMMVPLMPTLPLAIIVMLLRYSISQMDVPTRQSYTMAVVAPDERSAAAGVTGIARSLGAMVGPVAAGAMLSSSSWFAAPFFIAGGLKIVYDLLLYRQFNALPPPEEQVKVAVTAPSVNRS
jgi:MFS family permease